MCGKNICFVGIFENYFSENKIFENGSMAVWMRLFLDQLQRLIARICVTLKKYLIPLNNNTHQDLTTEI